jgi:SAM-dependent methyltransferase
MNVRLAKIDPAEHSHIVSAISNFFGSKKFQKILDVSSGQGTGSYCLKGLSDIAYCIDLDNYLDMTTLKGHYKDIRFTRYDGKAIPYEDNIFDVVYSFDVIEHCGNYDLFTKEAVRVLKNGGWLIIGTPNLNRLGNNLLKLFGKLKFPRKLGDSYYGECIHIKEFSDKELRNLFANIPIINHVKTYFIDIGLSSLSVSNPGGLFKNYCNYLLSIYQKTPNKVE